MATAARSAGSDIPAARDPRCTCSQVPHLQACRIEVERQQLAVALVLAARERMEESARGIRALPTAAASLRWYYSRLRRWSAPRSVDLEAAANGGGRSTRPNEPRRLFASIAFAIRMAEEDAAARGDAAPVGRWLEEHYRGGRSYANIAESSRERFTDRQVQRAMSRAHRVIRGRLERVGIIEGGEETT